MTATLDMKADVLPVLVAYESARLWGSVIITFEEGLVTGMEIHEKMRLAQQIRSWLRRVIRRSES